MLQELFKDMSPHKYMKVNVILSICLKTADGFVLAQYLVSQRKVHAFGGLCKKKYVDDIKNKTVNFCQRLTLIRKFCLVNHASFSPRN